MAVRIDICVGTRIGSLTVISPIIDGNHKCKCDCGNTIMRRKSILLAGLLRGSNSSCGCISKGGHNKIPLESFAVNRIYKQYRFGAKKHNREFKLTKTQVKELISLPCHYCGAETENYINRNGEIFYYNGIDRRNNNEGYIIENCVPCCKICNVAKHDLSETEFKDWLKKAYKWSSLNDD